ncbi:MAG: GGDEF domain-containing protein [Pseudomonadota bacterium]
MGPYNRLDIAENTADLSAVNSNSLKEREPSPTSRIFGTTIALLNQTQSDLEMARREIAALHKKVSALETLTTTDSLTGINNLRGFNEALHKEMDRVQRRKSVGGVIVMIDLNEFKAINDTHGHQAGDQCLKLVGQTLFYYLRNMDTVARLGGDEFVLLMTDTSSDLVAGRLQFIASRLNNLSIIWNMTEISISASIGMKPYAFADKPEDILAAADNNMYANKKREKEARTINS